MKIGLLKTGLFAWLLCLPISGSAQRFYSDDPLVSDPPPEAVEHAAYRSLNPLYMYLANRFGALGERHPDYGVIPAGGINAIGEVPDGPWFVNRHGRQRMNAEALVRGSGNQDPPNPKGPWRVVSFTKDEVLRPGLWIRDADGSLYILRFDPPGRLEMATGAAMIGSRLFHAMGFWIPEYYLVSFDRSRLEIAPPEEKIGMSRKYYRLEKREIDLFLETVSRVPGEDYRALAIKIPNGTERLGPFQFYGTRSDDPNDITPHEHRRELRGLHVLSSWVGNNWISASQTQDVLLKENGVSFIRHYIEDFLTYFGSGFHRAKEAREGFAALYGLKGALKNFAGLGAYSPEWQRTDYPAIDSIGRFESALFVPSAWCPNYKVAALDNRLPDDDYWAAKIVMAFTDEDIRTVVTAAQYSDPLAGDWIARCLIERRDKIGRYYFENVLPLDHFRLEGSHLKFEDLAVCYGFAAPREYSIQWAEFDNTTGKHRPVATQTVGEIPERMKTAETGFYCSALISAGEPEKTVTIYMRKESGGYRLVGVERSWPGKRIADESLPAD